MSINTTYPVFNSSLYDVPLRGERGERGATGSDGKDGTDGKDGATGATGAMGNSALFYYNNNQSFGGATLTPATGGHVITVSSLKNTGNVCQVNITIERQGGVYFNMPYTGTTGAANSQVIATLPSGYRPTSTISSIGFGANDNFWATAVVNWGGFCINSSGQIFQKCNADTTITTLQPNIERIAGQISYMTDGGSSFTGDGIV